MMSFKALLEKSRGLYYGWRMIAVSAVIRSLGAGVHLYGFTVFFLPLKADLGLSSAATSLAFSLARAEGTVVGPVVGYLIDRFGPRPVMIVAVAMAGAGYILLSTVHTYAVFLAIYMGVISLSFGAGFMHCPLVVANTWFIRGRAMAMGIISASMGIGGALISPLLAMAVHTWGWRAAAVMAGVGLLAVGVPCASAVRRSPESMGLLPDGSQGSPLTNTDHHGNGPTARSGAESAHTLREAMRTSSFWVIILATAIRVMAITTLMVHFIPIMVWKGIDEQRAAFLLGALAFLAVLASLLLGRLGDRFHKPRLMAFTMLIAAVALFLLIYGKTEWIVWLSLPFLASVEAVFSVSWATVGDIFGRKQFATIRGTMSFFYLWGGVIAPVIAGATYDRFVSYAPVLWGLVPLFLLAAFLDTLLGRAWSRSQDSQWRPA
jgi:MFS family permease